MRSVSERNPVAVGAVGLVVLAVVALLAFHARALPVVGGGTT
jgi:phospholipid/cholesterol/gamma-HCH transport system substrate-binding protein